MVGKIIADLAAQHLVPDAREIELLDRARMAADRIEELEAVVTREGMTYADKQGTVRPSPILAEIRSLTLVLVRALNAVQMEQGKGGKNPVKVRAGQASWNARLAREASVEGDY